MEKIRFFETMANLNHPAKQSFVAGEATLSMAT